MKKICLLLAILTLISCCLFSCSEKEVPVETPTEPVTEAPRKIKWSDIEESATAFTGEVIKDSLLNPSSFVQNSSWYSSSYLCERDGEKWIYFRINVDYSAQNRMGGFDRKTEYGYYKVALSLIGTDYNESALRLYKYYDLPFFDYLGHLDAEYTEYSVAVRAGDCEQILEYIEARENGTYWSKYDLPYGLQ